MADIEALHPEVPEIAALRHHAEGVRKLLQARGFVLLDREAALKRDAGIRLRHLEPPLSRSLRIMDHRDPASGDFGEERRHLFRIPGIRRNHKRRHGKILIVMRHKGFEHFSWILRRGAARECREERPVTEVPATPHHREIHAGSARLDINRENIGVRVASCRLNGLPLKDRGKRRDLVPRRRGRLEPQLRGFLRHLALQLIQNFRAVPLKEPLRALHVPRVVFR